jgi:hypothetical protein
MNKTHTQKPRHRLSMAGSSKKKLVNKKKPLTTRARRTMTAAKTSTPAATPTTQTELPSFATTKFQIPATYDYNDVVQFDSVEQHDHISDILAKGKAPSHFLSHVNQKHLRRVPNRELSRGGFEALRVYEGDLEEVVTEAAVPQSSVLVLPVSSKIGRKYVDDIRSGKVVEKMYRDITKTENLQEVYTPHHTYVHWFRLHERNQRDFLKRLGLIETKLTQRFGSTYYLHVSKAIRKYRKRFTILRGPFVHKKAQDTYEYNHHEYLCRVSYAFAITDPEINDFIYEQLKSQIIASGGGISFGWDVKLTKPKIRPQLFTPLSSPLLNRTGNNPDITQIKYANYVGQQELLRQHCDANGIDYFKYAGDSTLFPMRDDLLRFKDRKLKLMNSGLTPSEAEKQAYGESDISELSDPTYSEPSEEALGILKM